MENLRHEIMANFRRRNQTVRAWSKDHGFSNRTVLAVIHGEFGGGGSRGFKPVVSEEIRAALIEDGFWPVPNKDKAGQEGTHRQNS